MSCEILSHGKTDKGSDMNNKVLEIIFEAIRIKALIDCIKEKRGERILKPQRFQTGGIVQGPPSPDRVPIVVDVTLPVDVDHIAEKINESIEVSK